MITVAVDTADTVIFVSNALVKANCDIILWYQEKELMQLTKPHKTVMVNKITRRLDQRVVGDTTIILPSC